MPQHLDVDGRIESILEATSWLMAEHGVAGLTLRAIARESRVSGATLVHQLSSRERLLRVVCSVFAARRTRAIEARLRSAGVLAFLPEDESGLVDERVWWGWCELARAHDGPANFVARERREQRAMVGWALDEALRGDRLDDDTRDLLWALVEGLQTALCVPDDPMPLDRARALLTAGVERVLVRG